MLRRHVNCCRSLYHRYQSNVLSLIGKAEFLWSSSRHSLHKLAGCGPTIKLSTEPVKASGHVRSAVSLQLPCHLIWALRNVSVISAACFFHLRQIRRVRQSLQQQHSAMRLWLLTLTVTPYWPGRRKSQQTSCSASLATLGNLIAACRGYCTTNSTGSTSPTEHNSSLPWRCTDVSMELLRCTWRKVAHKNSRRRQSSTPPVRQSAENDRSAVSNGQLWSSVFRRCGPVDLPVAASLRESES